MPLRGSLAGAVGKVRRRAHLIGKRLRAPKADAKSLLIVSGVQRSGTNMLMDLFEAAPETDVFHEIDPRLYDTYMMRGDEVVASLLAASAFPVVVIKALHEPERVLTLMDRFAPARFIWMFRNTEDVVNSNMKSWPGGRNRLDDVVIDPANGFWRTHGMTADTLATLRAIYRPDMNDATAQGLFYWYRNKLFFDLGLADDSRTQIVDYDRMVADPGGDLPRIAAHAGTSLTDRMRAIPHPGSVKKRRPPDIAPEVMRLCTDIHARLRAAAEAQTEKLIAA